MEYPFGKALKRRVGCETPPERAARETGAVSGPGAKHLKTVSERPLIGHGGPVTGKGRRQPGEARTATRVEPRFMESCGGYGIKTSLAIAILQGAFLRQHFPAGFQFTGRKGDDRKWKNAGRDAGG